VDPNEPIASALRALVDRLHASGRLRVWSLVITIFGDMVVPRGGRAALSLLQEIAGRLGVEAGAMRTAMSRLAADGWVERERAGRNSFYRPAERGRHAFDLATRRIYAGRPPAWNGNWTVLVAPPEQRAADAGEEASALGFVRVAAGVYLRPDAEGAPPIGDSFAGMLVVHGASAEHPETILSLWPAQETAAAYRSFIAAYRVLADLLRGGARFDGLDAVAARALLIHDWRRIVLRDPGLPAELLPADWPGEEARRVARDIYAALAAPSEAWLDEAGLPAQVEARTFRMRFDGSVQSFR
jgi:phenylacetic acid degradation operon negative regulatory protein